MASRDTRQRNSSPKRPVSACKAEANRQNALHSTGPKTIAGKAYSRRNALKHGFFAEDLFSDLLVRTENPQQFQKFLEELQQAYKPVGTLEDLEVQRIAVCRWRLMRLERFENAEICSAQLEVASQEHIDPPKAMPPEHKALIALLKKAPERN